MTRLVEIPSGLVHIYDHWEHAKGWYALCERDLLNLLPPGATMDKLMPDSAYVTCIKCVARVWEFERTDQ